MKRLLQPCSLFFVNFSLGKRAIIDPDHQEDEGISKDVEPGMMINTERHRPATVERSKV